MQASEPRAESIPRARRGPKRTSHRSLEAGPEREETRTQASMGSGVIRSMSISLAEIDLVRSLSQLQGGTSQPALRSSEEPKVKRQKSAHSVRLGWVALPYITPTRHLMTSAVVWKCIIDWLKSGLQIHRRGEGRGSHWSAEV